MKKLTALIICTLFLLLTACSNKKDENIRYINQDLVTRVGQEALSGWGDFQTPTQSGSSDTTLAASDISELLPENFPDMPEGIYNLTMVKKTNLKETGYPADFTEMKFVCEYMTLVNFSQALKEVGYKGGIQEITDGTYYPTGIHGAWQDGNYIVRIVGTTAIADGTHEVTIHIVPCQDLFPEEVAKLSTKFNGFSGAAPLYYEYVNDETVRRDFDGSFHAKWKLAFTSDYSFVGVTIEDVEQYCADLESKGFTIGTVESGELDGCNVFLGDAASSDESIYILYIYNQSLSTLDLYITNNVEGIMNELYGE